MVGQGLLWLQQKRNGWVDFLKIFHFFFLFFCPSVFGNVKQSKNMHRTFNVQASEFWSSVKKVIEKSRECHNHKA